MGWRGPSAVTDGSLTYRYRALRANGVSVRGTVLAQSADAAAVTLTNQSLFPVAIESVPQHSERKSTVPVDDLALGLRMLANLIESGLPIGKTVAAFEELAP